jgi:hypothetical protein
MNSAASSAMLYTVEPPLSVAEFTSSAPSDLQVLILYVTVRGVVLQCRVVGTGLVTGVHGCMTFVQSNTL